ncbi:hypothetical protein [Ferrovibrio xuzhouensis]|uniref:Membrane-associated oxidoreductase n=1 Tax=Ferrovibrio xuzhouensis TaxID=1576914 RepID=A0ABV7VFT0_9PROT
MALQPTSAAEKELIDTGSVSSITTEWSPISAAHNWPKERTIRGDFLTSYIKNKNKEHSSLDISNALIDGPLYLDHLTFEGTLRFSGCEFSNALFLDSAALGNFLVSECRFNSEIYGIGLSVEKDTHLINSVFLKPTTLMGCHIKGTLALSGSRFHSTSEDNAISLESATIGQGVRCRDNFYILGCIDFFSATILGSVEFIEGHIAGKNAKIRFDESTIHGSLRFTRIRLEGPLSINSAHVRRHLQVAKCRLIKHRARLELHSTIVDGPVIVDDSRISSGIMLIALQTKSFVEIRRSLIGNLDEDTSIIGSGASIGLGLYVRNGSRFTKCFKMPLVKIGNSAVIRKSKFYGHPESIGFNQSSISGGIEIGPNVLALGLINLENATVGFDARFIQSCVNLEKQKNREIQKTALNISHSKIAQALIFDTGWRCDGAIRLNNTAVGGDFSIASSTPEKNSINSIIAHGLSVGGAILMHKNLAIGHLDLRDASCRTLIDSEHCWPPQGQMKLDRFIYSNIGGYAPTDVSTRLKWLLRQSSDHLAKNFRPQPFEQLAHVLKRMGHEVDSRTILIEKQRRLRLSGRLGGVLAKFRHAVLDMLVGYGYRPTKALMWGSIVILFGWVVFHIGHSNGYIGPTKARMFLSKAVSQYDPADTLPSLYPSFNGLIYSIDSFLPVLDLQQEAYWVPRHINHKGQVDYSYRIYYWVHTLLGWLITTLAIAGFTGLIKRD